MVEVTTVVSDSSTKGICKVKMVQSIEVYFHEVCKSYEFDTYYHTYIFFQAHLLHASKPSELCLYYNVIMLSMYVL